jgi:hypothetical protein
MQATLSFTLPQEYAEHEAAVYGQEYKSVVRDIDQYLRDQIKYANLEGSALEELEKARAFLRDCTDGLPLE